MVCPSGGRSSGGARAGAIASRIADAATASGSSSTTQMRGPLSARPSLTLVLLASVWSAFSGSAREREPQSLRPGIENAVADVFWLL